MNKATFDPSKRLDLYFRIGRNGSKGFTFLNSDGSARSFIYDEFSLLIKRYPGDNKNTIILDVGSGLSYFSNTLTATVTASQTNITEGQYYWELYNDHTGETWLNGFAYFHYGVFDGVSEDSTTITIGDDQVTIIINTSGSQKTRTYSTTSTATLTPDIDNYDMFVITAQAEALTIANPTGTPVNGDSFVIRIKDNGTARAINFGNKYRAIGSALKTTTTISKTLYIPVTYNSADDKYDTFSAIEEQ